MLSSTTTIPIFFYNNTIVADSEWRHQARSYDTVAVARACSPRHRQTKGPNYNYPYFALNFKDNGKSR